MELAVLALLIGALAPPLVEAAPAWDFAYAAAPGGRTGTAGLFGRLAAGAPPWAGEAPQAARARFGLGLDLFFERQESLRIAAIDQVVRTRSLATSQEVVAVLPGDPGLLNRKFDILWEMAGAGVEMPIALPSFGGRIFPTLNVAAAGADVRLDFRDRTVARDSASLSGRGQLFGAGLDVVAALCRSCPLSSWFSASGYRYQRIAGLAADRSPSFQLPGFAVLEDESRLEREVHDLTTRVAYGASDRFAPFVGVRRRWTELTVEDELGYRDGVNETHLSSRTRLESATTLALAGVDARLGPRLFGALETAIGDGDYAVAFRVVSLGPAPQGEIADQRAAGIATEIEAIRVDFVAARDRLVALGASPGAAPAPLLARALELLSGTERRLLAALGDPGLRVMRQYVQNRFRAAEKRLGAGASAARAPIPRAVPAAWRPRGAARAELAEGPERPAGSGSLGEALEGIGEVLGWIAQRVVYDDLKADVCVRTEPATGAIVTLRPFAYHGKTKVRSNDLIPFKLPRGEYSYEVKL